MSEAVVTQTTMNGVDDFSALSKEPKRNGEHQRRVEIWVVNVDNVEPLRADELPE
jgi:hypothetical protein